MELRIFPLLTLKSISWFGLMFLPTFFVAAHDKVSVTATSPVNVAHGQILDKDESDSTGEYPWLFLAKSGLDGAPSSGALSLGSLRYRGFSSPQLSISVDGYSLANAGTGLIDLYDLPIFAATQIDLAPGISEDALGAQLRLRIAISDKFFAKSKATFGSHNFGNLNLLVGSGELNGTRILSALQIASSRGDYFFLSSPSSDLILSRSNNDNTRLLGLIKTQHTLDQADLEFIVLGRHHEGGLPGPATFPTQGLRISSQKLLLGSSVNFALGPFPSKLKWETHLDRNETRDHNEANLKSVTFLENSLRFVGEHHFDFADTFASLGATLGSSQTLDGRFRRYSARADFKMNTAPFSFWSMRFQRSASFDYHSDVGWFLGFGTNISATPIESLTLGIRFAKNSRPPTLSEMFAPQGVVLPNPDLQPEKLYDSSLYFKYTLNTKLKLDLEFLYAYLAKAIFYVNRNSFFLEPVNVDNVHRGGIALGAVYNPQNYLQFDFRGDWLASHISATRAPIPGATPLSITFNSRFGKECGIFGRVGAVINAGASSNLFGTLKTEPYALLNASVHVPLSDQANVILSGTNLTNNRWAKSAYQYPMPGFELFITLETKS